MLKTCNVCKSESITSVWNLPEFPLTGIYVDDPKSDNFQNEYEQELQFCHDCTHAQLGNQIDPTFLYRDTYTHRTSESPISSSGNKYLLEHIRNQTADRKFKQVLEIGCNDLYLLESLKDRSDAQAGIDPIWPDGIKVSENGIKLWGGFAEEVKYNELLETKIDLLITAHTFEHVTDPKAAVESLKGHLSDDCVVIIEVPSAERMLEQGRLDQVFNQHVNYYTVKSLEALFAPLGLHLINLNYNFQYWGGTQLLTFTMSKPTEAFEGRRVISNDDYLSAIKLFQDAMKNTSRQIEQARGPVYLYGAAQMLPPLVYHLNKVALDKVQGIIDDNSQRQNKFFPNLEIPIVPSSQISNFRESTIIISALDSSRPILQRILSEQPRTILIPNGLI